MAGRAVLVTLVAQQGKRPNLKSLSSSTQSHDKTSKMPKAKRNKIGTRRPNKKRFLTRKSSPDKNKIKGTPRQSGPPAKVANRLCEPFSRVSLFRNKHQKRPHEAHKGATRISGKHLVRT